MLPNVPGRKRKPQAFRRATIDISHHGREWKAGVKADTLEVGDSVKGFGLISNLEKLRTLVVLGNPIGVQITLRKKDEVEAFVKTKK